MSGTRGVAPHSRGVTGLAMKRGCRTGAAGWALQQQGIGATNFVGKFLTDLCTAQNLPRGQRPDGGAHQGGGGGGEHVVQDRDLRLVPLWWTPIFLTLNHFAGRTDLQA